MGQERRSTQNPRDRKTSRLFSEPAAIMAPRLMFILSVVGLCVFGLIMVYSASSITAHNEFGDSSYYIKRQVIFLVVGVILCVVLSRIPYSLWSTPAVFITFWVITVVLLALTAFGMGVSALGAERSIVIAGFNLQPAEFAKITVIIAAASIVKMRMDGMIDGRNFIIVVFVATLVPLFLIYRQPDLGTAIILAIGFIALALLVGISWKVIFVIFGAVVLYVVFACITQPYHLQRIVSMFNPWVDPQGQGYQSIQSLYAFGNGGVFGTGLGLSRQKYLYLPYAHTDFIFSIIGEELGLLGAVSVVCLFGIFIYAGMRICRMAPDMFGCMLSGTFTVMIGFQACVNMACVTGIAPVTGKALPLISYGGSSMVATMIMIGFILSVSFRSKVGMAYERKRDNFLIIEGGGGSAPQAQGKPNPNPSANVIGFDVARRSKGSAKGQSVRENGYDMRERRPRKTRHEDSASAHSTGYVSGGTRSDVPKGYAGLKPKRDSRHRF